MAEKQSQNAPVAASTAVTSESLSRYGKESVSVSMAHKGQVGTLIAAEGVSGVLKEYQGQKYLSKCYANMSVSGCLLSVGVDRLPADCWEVVDINGDNVTVNVKGGANFRIVEVSEISFTRDGVPSKMHVVVKLKKV